MDYCALGGEQFMAAYVLEIWNAEGKCVVPGFMDNQLFRSASPIPVPEVGETLEVAGGKPGDRWKVTRRHFSYANANDGNEPAVKVDLFCEAVSDKEWYKPGMLRD